MSGCLAENRARNEVTHSGKFQSYNRLIRIQFLTSDWLWIYGSRECKRMFSVLVEQTQNFPLRFTGYGVVPKM
jgi:hypothetical protein